MNKSKPRKTLAKEIRRIAKSNELSQIYAAFQTANLGHSLTPLEELVWVYHGTNGLINNKLQSRRLRPVLVTLRHPGAKEIKTNAFELVRAHFKYSKASLQEIFMSALNAKDAKKIHEIAEAIHFLKHHTTPDDPDRENLLALKMAIQTGLKKMTIREIAEFLKGSNASISLDSPEDGYSALRRKCKEINLPLASSRKIKE